MRSSALLSLLAVSSFSLAKDDDSCSDDIEVKEAQPSINCKTVEGSITVDSSVAGELVLDGPEQIKGDLIIKNNTGLLSISSNTISAIGGSFELSELEGLSSIRFDSLDTINDLIMVKVPQLRDMIFGSEGVTKASKVRVTNTKLDNLSGLKLSSVDSLTIDNNVRMVQFNSDLTNITTELIINSNGADMQINMTKLEQAKEIQIGNAKSFYVPALEKVEGSLKFDKNPEMESFTAPNLTSVTNAVSFINNKKIGNISLPLLKTIGGDLTIVNNTEVKEVDGFPELTSVGSIMMGGNFDGVELPKLEDVKGSANVTSTTDISDFCDFFDKAKDDKKIDGKESCTSNNKDAVEGGEGGEENSGNSGSDDKEDAAGFVSINFAVLGLSVVAGFAQLL